MMKMAQSYPKGRIHFGNGEIAIYEQFLLLPQCFLKTCTAGFVWERVNGLGQKAHENI